MRNRAVVAPPHVARGIPDQHAEQARRVLRLLHERARLRQEEERLEGLLDRVERVLGTEPSLRAAAARPRECTRASSIPTGRTNPRGGRRRRSPHEPVLRSCAIVQRAGRTLQRRAATAEPPTARASPALRGQSGWGSRRAGSRGLHRSRRRRRNERARGRAGRRSRRKHRRDRAPDACSPRSTGSPSSSAPTASSSGPRCFASSSGSGAPTRLRRPSRRCLAERDRAGPRGRSSGSTRLAAAVVGRRARARGGPPRHRARRGPRCVGRSGARRRRALVLHARGGGRAARRARPVRAGHDWWSSRRPRLTSARPRRTRPRCSWSGAFASRGVREKVALDFYAAEPAPMGVAGPTVSAAHS